MQGALECVGIPFVGCPTLPSAICYDKATTKAVAESLSIPTVPWRLLTAADIRSAKKEAESFMKYPFFLKPSGLGSSFGAAVIENAPDFDKSSERAYDLGGGRVLIEELVDIDAELECGYFATKCAELFTNVGEIRCNEGFYDYDTKYISDSAKTSSIAPVSDEMNGRIKEFSRELGERIGIRGIARFDYFLTRDGRLLFNEINTIPGFTDTSLYPKMLEASGLDVKEALTELITDAIGER